jgi:CDP-diacylglycerol--glycerol-3-phosphate 3-phosphatidyltransferase/cardiolipin synthase
VLVLLVEDQPSIWLALPAAVIIGREITISALREWMAELGASSKVAVSGYGKLKTICQMVALGFLIYHNDLFSIPIYTIGMVLLYIASILTLWSMILYLQAAWPQLKDS